MEFVDTMLQWKRMCGVFCKKAQEELTSCGFTCPLGVSEMCAGGVFEGLGREEIERGAEIIQKWAEENPEPVYPTWGEWFVSMGMLSDEWDNTYSPFRYVGYLPSLMRTPIPVDIAEKLGIKPKEKK